MEEDRSPLERVGFFVLVLLPLVAKLLSTPFRVGGLVEERGGGGFFVLSWSGTLEHRCVAVHS